MIICFCQGEAGPPSEKELVTNAVQQAVGAPTGTDGLNKIFTVSRFSSNPLIKMSI